MSLVELLISLVLGLLVIAGVSSLFLTSKQSSGTNRALGEVQDKARIGFELMARDLRQAGLTGCGNNGRIANVLNNGPHAGGTVDWWANFANAARGYDGSAADPAVTTGSGIGQRVAGTSSLQVIGAGPTILTVAGLPNGPTAANFHTNEPATGLLNRGDVIIICDPDHAAITQITNPVTGSSPRIDHNTGTGSPGNCSKGLGFPTDCSSANGNSYIFGPNSLIATLQSVDWFIGNNPLGGRSLYRTTVVNGSATLTPTAQEMVRNVTDLQIAYHVAGAAGFVSATAVGANWANVDAVQVAMAVAGSDQRASTAAQPLTRQLISTITLRNRTN